ncbi:MAG: hypothetical protein U0935_02045 [Pirellulales bacterium]
MGLEDRQGKYDVEQNRTRASENKSGGAASSSKSKDDAAIKAQQQQTRDAVKKTLGR